MNNFLVKFKVIFSTLVNKLANLLILLSSFVSLAYFVSLFGFNFGVITQSFLVNNFHQLVNIFFISYLIRFFTEQKVVGRKKLLEYVLLILLFLAVVIHYFNLVDLFPFLKHNIVRYSLVLLISGLEISRWSFAIINRTVNPSLLFVLSFLFIIITGALLLMLPKATVSPIKFIDALFTSTSAVCVTGLIVVDTATQFTDLGKTIIIVLIQIGGIGVMTFTTFFAFLFMKSGFHHRVVLKELLSENTLSGIFKILGSIIVVTFTIEAIGAVYIYYDIGNISGIHPDKRVFFSIFHSISAFCNAGFSTLTGNMADPLVKNQYSLHTGIAFLIIFGGIGFPILLNFAKYIHLKAKRLFFYIFFRKRILMPSNIISVNTRLAIRCTLVLILLGAVSFYFLEQNNTLKGLSVMDKIAVSFFNSVTPRTAGFNNIDFTACLTPTILIIIFLMWVGASPMSTGGGIKTTTFSIVLLNLKSVVYGRERTDFANRTITANTISRAHAVMILSILWLILAIFLVSVFESKTDILPIIFECFSALGTVGLTLDLTPNLTNPSKVVIILTMFFGRVGLLSLLISLFPKPKQQRYKYPEESVMT